MMTPLTPGRLAKEIRECVKSGTPFVYLNISPIRLRVSDARLRKGTLQVLTLFGHEPYWRSVIKGQTLSLYAGYPFESVCTLE